MADQNNQTIRCTECENDFQYDVTNVQVGDILECEVCGATLEVTNTDPVTVEAIMTSK